MVCPLGSQLFSQIHLASGSTKATGQRSGLVGNSYSFSELGARKHIKDKDKSHTEQPLVLCGYCVCFRNPSSLNECTKAIPGMNVLTISEQNLAEVPTMNL